MQPDYGVVYSKIDESRSKISISFDFFQPLHEIFATVKIYVAASDGKVRYRFFQKTVNWCEIDESPYSDFLLPFMKECRHPCPMKMVKFVKLFHHI